MWNYIKNMCPCHWLVGIGAVVLFVVILGIATGHAQDKPPFPPCPVEAQMEAMYQQVGKFIETGEHDTTGGKLYRYQGKEAEQFLHYLISLTPARPPELFDEIIVYVHADPTDGVNASFGKDGCIKNFMRGWPRAAFEAIQEEMKGKRT